MDMRGEKNRMKQQRDRFSGKIGYVLAVAGSAVGLSNIAKEVEISSAFKRRKMYDFCMKYIAPIFLVIILLSSIANVMGWIAM